MITEASSKKNRETVKSKTRRVPADVSSLELFLILEKVEITFLLR